MSDDFQRLHRQIGEADGLVVVTPVCWWDMSESAKALLDRLRRCEAMRVNNKVQGKPFICIAAAVAPALAQSTASTPFQA